MQPFEDLEQYRKSIYKLFSRFPWIMMVTLIIVVLIVDYVMVLVGISSIQEPFGFEGFSTAFFRGVLASVLIYYISRMAAESVIKNSKNLEERENDGVFIPCMSHKTATDLSTGNIIIQKDRIYFEPIRPFGGDRTFDYTNYQGFQFDLSEEVESKGLYLITGEKFMLIVKNPVGERVGRFIIPEPEYYLAKLKELL